MMIDNYIYSIKIAVFLFGLYIIPTSCLLSQNSINSDSVKVSISNINKSFSSFQDSITANFNNFQKNQQKAFDDFKKDIKEKWGEGNFSYSDSVNWVEYYKGNNVRSTVNFKEGKAYVELLVEPDVATDNEKLDNKVSVAIKELALTKGKVNDFELEEDKQNKLSEEPILQNQLITEEGVKVTEENIDQFTKEIIDKEEIKQITVKGTDGKSRTLISISIPLAPDYLQVRANKILPIVTKYANQYNIEPELILSVIHVESYFNPKAISHANAIGLMQLVPSSGGQDSYEYVYGKSQQPSRRFLFDSDNNINLGTAYLKILMTKYFDGITNDENKRHCVVSSYNTGIGNVCLAVSGDKVPSNTVKIINRMTTNQTYSYLSSNLKYREAREYIVKVNNKYLMYKKWLEYE
jgi:membrane-bound lytic murein transglycosylase C